MNLVIFSACLLRKKQKAHRQHALAMGFCTGY